MDADEREVESLAKAIRELHGVEARFEHSVHVNEVFQGHVVWSGPVLVFSLSGHPTASRCYAWSHPLEGKRRVVSILREGEIDSPVEAVRAAVIEELRSRRGPGGSRPDGEH